MQSDPAYETIPYPSFTFSQTHPDRLASMAAFLGMTPARPEKSRVLELGCGDGSNLLSFAYAMPGSDFVGVDLGKIHIDKANAATGDLGLSNISFHCEDLMEFTRERFGEFDFILAHGLFSWVPDQVRTKVLEIYSACLAPNGVGYISYNVYPGSRIREMVWEMMQFHVADIKDRREKVRHGRSFVKFVHDAATEPLHKALVGNELSQFAVRTDANIFHEEFAEVNQPFYFNEFAGKLEPSGLQFLCEADPKLFNYGRVGPDARKMLDSFDSDLLSREQYFDFIKCRRFRSSLIGHSTIQLRRDPGPEILKNFLISTDVRPASSEPNIVEDIAESFVNSKGTTFQTNHSLTKAAIVILDGESPRRIGFVDLIERSKDLIAPGSGFVTSEDTEKTASFFMQLFYAGFIDLHRFQPDLVMVVSERPAASAFARRQVELGSETVTTLNGTNLKLDDKLASALLLLLDGTRDVEELNEEMKAGWATNGLDDGDQLNPLPDKIQFVLKKFADFGLLVP